MSHSVNSHVDATSVSAMANGLGRVPPIELPVIMLLWLATGAMLLPVLLIGAYGFGSWIASERAKDLERVQQYTESLARAIDRDLNGAIEFAEVLAGSRQFQLGDIEAAEELIRDAAARAGGRVSVVDRTFRQLVNTWASRGAFTGNTTNESEVARVFETGTSIVGNLGTDSITGQLNFAVRAPIKVKGEVRYVLSYSPAPDTIIDLVNSIGRPSGWMAAVVDGAGRIVARSERHSDFFGQSATPGFLKRATGQQGVVESVDLEGRSSVTAYHSLGIGDWRVFAWVPKAQLEWPAKEVQRLVLALAGLTLLTSLATAWLVNRAIAGPTRGVVEAAHALGAGKRVHVVPSIMREANIIGNALAEAAKEIEHREARLKDSEARFRNMADHAPVMVWVSDPDGAATFLSASWYEFTALSADAGLKFGWLAAVHPDDREQVLAAYHEDIRANDASRIEYRLRRADGAWRWVLDTARPRFGGNDRLLGYIGSVIDITERKQREEQINLLLREVNHRSKNMLALVMAVARQTLASDSGDFVSRFSDRIQALAASQDILVKNDWQGADVRELITSQIAHFADLVDQRIVLDGPELRLLPAAAQSIGMALHELATNAGKYGALSTDAGRVEVSWSVKDGDKPRFVMSWRETRGPVVEPPGRRGFGSTVVETMVRLGLNGTVDLTFAVSGVTWRLDCLAALAVEGARIGYGRVREASDRIGV
jgi:PAS domain S-box-containing protein